MIIHGNNSRLVIGGRATLPDGTVTENKLSSDLIEKIDGKEDASYKVNDLEASLIDGQNLVEYPTTYAVGEYVGKKLSEVDAEKEDRSNKVTSITSASTDTQYPTAKAVNVAIGNVSESVKNTTQWQLVQSVTLTEKVNRVYPTLGGNYKSVFVKIDIPTVKSETVTTVGTARGYLRVGNVVVHMNNTYEWEDIGYMSRLSYKMYMVGTTCVTEGRYAARTDTNQNNDRGKYAQNLQTNGGVTLGTNYISSCDVEIASADGLRCFPVGTKYEVWGIKA